MEFELEARPPDDTRQWHRSLAMLALLIALVVAAQLYGARVRQKGEAAGSAARDQALVSGDFYVKLDQVFPSGSSTAAALRDYRRALPWPSAYRRLGILKEASGKSGIQELSKIDSKEAARGMDKKDIAKLRREKAMWLRVFAAPKLSPDEARRDVKEIESLNLGPLKGTAIGLVYRRADLQKKYEEFRAEAKASAGVSLGLMIGLAGLLVIGGCAGLVGAILFLVQNEDRFAAAPRLPLQSSMLMSAFIIYLASYIGLSGLVQVMADAFGFASVGKWSGVAYMGVVILAAAIAFCLGLLVLVGRAKELGQDWRQIGFRTANAGRAALLGIAGFFCSLPFVFVAGVIAAILSHTIFKHFHTPEQPFDEIVTQGSTLEVILVFLAASVVAPIVEETFFRGTLYSVFRSKTGVWPSVLLTSAIFAIIHPLPGGFLPIFTLACVLALLRERTGSLLPGMVCHAVYNTMILIFAALLR